MTFSGHKTSEILLGVVTGVCLAASGLSAGDSSTASTKPTTHLATGSPHSVPTHAVAKKAGAPRAGSHSTANLQKGEVVLGTRAVRPGPYAVEARRY